MTSTDEDSSIPQKFYRTYSKVRGMEAHDFRDARVLAEQILTDLKTAETRLTDPDATAETRQIAREDLDRAGAQAQELDERINDLIAAVDEQLAEDA